MANQGMVFTAIFAGLATWFFMYLDARLFDTPKSKLTYLKGIGFVSSLAALIVYFMPKGSSPGLMSGGCGPSLSDIQGTTYIPDVGQEIITGMPRF